MCQKVLRLDPVLNDPDRKHKTTKSKDCCSAGHYNQTSVMLANEQKGKGWFCYKVKEPHLRGLGDLGLRSAGQGRNVKATTDLGKGICLSE